ncbi:MAG: 16S rRNA (uracil(1498)-N(3))-methyltransferase [Bacteroidetes bacterium]|nr:16S rRNA (uracil(1498)-N(3))-methyltransferase [Bacteroidota bacterium]
MASLPFFFHEEPVTPGAETWLDEDTSKHVGQVLRMQVGEPLLLTDGKGVEADAVISSVAKKKCSVVINKLIKHDKPQPQLHLAIAFTKNTSRNEWLLEKATELGVSSIIPLSVSRSERERIRADRWRSILISAMLQSQQYWLPDLADLTTLDKLQSLVNVDQKFVAHCIASKQRHNLSSVMKKGKDSMILIGPEGDFTEEEVNWCEANSFVGVSIANQRLRTETAAMAVCAYFNTINHG